MLVGIEFRGTTPLLCHNEQLVDPENAVVMEMKPHTDKPTNKRTEADRKAIERFEWYGGLYREGDNGPPVIPARNIRKSISEAAKVRKLGKDVERALSMTSVSVPIDYDGPRDVDALFGNKAFHSRLTVRLTGRIMRVRPKFPQWRVRAEAELLEDVLDFNTLQYIVDLAGRIEGLGDARRIGFGRYVGTVEQLS